MASKNNPSKTPKTPPRPAAKTRGELDVKDLDKVSGGLRRNPKPGDPCDGGE